MKIINLVKTYTILKDSKVTKLEDKDKISIIKDMCLFRPIYEKMEADEKEATEKMKGEDHEEILKLVEKDKLSKSDSTVEKLTEEEIKRVNDYFNKYYSSLNIYLNELHNEDKELSINKLSEDGFSKLISSNDFTCEQLMILHEVLC